MGSDQVGRFPFGTINPQGWIVVVGLWLGHSAWHRPDTRRMFAKGKVEFREGWWATWKGLWHVELPRGLLRRLVPQHGPDPGEGTPALRVCHTTRVSRMQRTRQGGFGKGPELSPPLLSHGAAGMTGHR